MQLPEIKTERLILRMYRPEDLETVYKLCSDPYVTKFFPDYYTIERDYVLSSMPRRLDRWRKQGFGQFGVFDKESEQLIGYCGLQYLDNTEEVEIYYGLFKDFWGKGLATEAAKANLRFGFETVKLDKIVAATHPGNTDSHKVLKKIGMRQGEDTVFYKIDACYFFIFAEDYKPDGALYELNFREVQADGNL